MGKTHSQPVYPKSLDFEQVWTALMENMEQLKKTEQIVNEVAERQKETDRQMKEYTREIKEALMETAERQKATTLQMNETDRHVNKWYEDFTNHSDGIDEKMIKLYLLKKLRDFGYNFLQASSNCNVSDHKNNIFFDTGVFLQNGEKAMLVEVRTKLTTEDIRDHIKILEKMRTYADLHGDKHTFLGAVAGVAMTADVKNYALGQGFYVIEPYGETFNITSPSGQPKEW